MFNLKTKLRKYFSGRLAIIQITAGVGAFVGRSAAAYLTDDHGTWTIVLASQFGSFAGYIGTYVAGYWLAFKSDYRASGRSLGLDLIRLQLVEQSPNISTVVSSALTQSALIGSGGLSPVLAANLASWFGPHKIVNLVAMAASNSLKKAWVDGTWRPLAGIQSMFRGLKWIGKHIRGQRGKRVEGKGERKTSNESR